MRRSFDEALATVAPIVADVRERGDEALLDWTARLDGPRQDGIRVSAAHIAALPMAREWVVRRLASRKVLRW